MEKIGFSARIKGLSLAEQVNKAKELGLSYVEIVAEIFWGLPGNRQVWAEVKSAIQKSNITPILHAPYIEINPASIKKEISRAAFEQYSYCLELANYIGAIYMVIHPGNLNRNYPAELINQARKILTDGLKNLCKKAEERKIPLGLENGWNGENYPIIDCPERHVEIVNMVSSPWLKIVVDIGHANTFDININNYIKKVGNYLIGLHLHDNLGNRDEHLPLGKGSINKDVFALCLKQNVPAILELNSLDDINTSLKFLKKLASVH